MPILKIGLAGNPNSGKSTLFNVLTGGTQRIGNWSGVTVERKTGYFSLGDWRVEIIDLPGVYGLTTHNGETAVDTQIACDAILSGEFDFILNVVDVNNLERNLYLTLQLLELQTPMLVIANMQDVAHKRGIEVDNQALSHELNCPVIPASANQLLEKSDSPDSPSHLTIPSKCNGITLKRAIIDDYLQQKKHHRQSQKTPHYYSEPLASTINKITAKITSSNIQPHHQRFARFLALAALEDDPRAVSLLPRDTMTCITQIKKELEQTAQEEADILLADARYSHAHTMTKSVIKMPSVPKSTFTERLDKIVLHRIFGIPIFFAVIYAMFFFAINVGGALQPFFDETSSVLFIQGTEQILEYFALPSTFSHLIAAGIGSGFNTVITFIPVIAALFLFLSFLESSGYMARAAYVIDRAMRFLGLPGKAFVPFIVGFGCNVPAILASRTLESRRDRLLLLMMMPFMSCSARLAIYAVFTTAFFPQGGQNIVFILYLTGILLAVLTGFVLRKTLLSGEATPWIVELPVYHKPSWRVLSRLTWRRLKQFLIRAGKVIVPACLLLSFLNAFNIKGEFVTESQDSILAHTSKIMTPVFHPMGIESENWQATVGLVTGILAKEVVVGTLNALYAQTSQPTVSINEKKSTIPEQIWQAFTSIPEQFLGLKESLSNPIAASAADAQLDESASGVMYRHFGEHAQAAAMAYLLFVLLYFPCISAIAALIKEASLGWASFSTLWTTLLAYLVAVMFYQLATWKAHPWSSSLWAGGALLVIILFWSMIKIYTKRWHYLFIQANPVRF